MSTEFCNDFEEYLNSHFWTVLVNKSVVCLTFVSHLWLICKRPCRARVLKVLFKDLVIIQWYRYKYLRMTQFGSCSCSIRFYWHGEKCGKYMSKRLVVYDPDMIDRCRTNFSCQSKGQQMRNQKFFRAGDCFAELGHSDKKFV